MDKPLGNFKNFNKEKLEECRQKLIWKMYIRGYNYIDIEKMFNEINNEIKHQDLKGS